jgi:hypothetical protein
MVDLPGGGNGIQLAGCCETGERLRENAWSGALADAPPHPIRI